jgi:hypothetical protein
MKCWPLPAPVQDFVPPEQPPPRVKVGGRTGKSRRKRATNSATKGGAQEPAPAPAGDKARRNFTDPGSRTLQIKDGFIQGYNAQAPVDVESSGRFQAALSGSPNQRGWPKV